MHNAYEQQPAATLATLPQEFCHRQLRLRIVTWLPLLPRLPLRLRLCHCLPGRLPHANALRAAWKSISLRMLQICGSPRCLADLAVIWKFRNAFFDSLATRYSRLARYLMRREARGVTDAFLWRPQNVSSFSLTAFCTYKSDKHRHTQRQADRNRNGHTCVNISRLFIYPVDGVRENRREFTMCFNGHTLYRKCWNCLLGIYVFKAPHDSLLAPVHSVSCLTLSRPFFFN